MAEIISATVRQMNLGNGIVTDAEPGKEALQMASKFNSSYAYMTPDGKKATIRLYGANKADTDLKYQQFLISLYGTKDEEPADTVETNPFPLFSEMAERYKQIKLPKLKQSTAKTNLVRLKNQILPFFGQYRINEITPQLMQSFIDKLAGSDNLQRKPYTRVSIKLIISVVNQILNIAIGLGYDIKNPCNPAILNIGGASVKHHRAIPDEKVLEIKKMIPTLDEQERMCCALLVYTGMRIGEVFGLRWEDIHLDERYISIQRTLSKDINGRVIVSSPKTEGSVREVVICESLFAILDPLKKDSGFLFSDGEVPTRAFTSRISRGMFKKLGIEEYTNHDFRVTFATQLKESGLSLPLIADMLGHKNTKMIEDVYGVRRHETIIKQRDAFRVMDVT